MGREGWMSSKVFQPVTTRKRNQLEPVNVSLAGKRKKHEKRMPNPPLFFFLGGGVEPGFHVLSWGGVCLV